MSPNKIKTANFFNFNQFCNMIWNRNFSDGLWFNQIVRMVLIFMGQPKHDIEQEINEKIAYSIIFQIWIQNGHKSIIWLEFG